MTSKAEGLQTLEALNRAISLPARSPTWPGTTRTWPRTTNFDRAATVASIERMKQLAANLKATVIIQHDMRDIGKVPAFPAAAK